MTLTLLADSTAHIALHRVGSSWMWYVIRGAGFAAAGLLVLLMLSGIGQVTGMTYRLFEPVKAWLIHKALGIALCFAIGVHVGLLLFDRFMPFSPAQVFVPFVSHYTNGSTLLGLSLGGVAVALGVLAMYGVVIVVASSLGWIDSRQKQWRWLHYLSYFIMLAVFVHALSTGSDLKHGVFRTIWIALIVLIAGAVVSRIMRAGTLRRKR